MSTDVTRAPHASAVGVPLLVALGMLSMLGPFSTDAFLPALPTMADDLHAQAGQVQLSLTGVTLGMAIGQLLAGPLSDGIGRRMPLLIGSAAMTVAAVGAAFAPSLVVLVACCAAMGLGASFGMVVGRAVISDLAEGAVLTRAYALLGTLIGLGPVLSPIFGVAVMWLWGWRAIFVGLGVLAAIGLALVAFLVPESLPHERRLAHPLRSLPRNAATALHSRAYLGGATVVWFGFVAQFGYIAASAFLIQSVLGLSPLVYAITFGVNGLGLIGAGLVTARLSATWSNRALMALGLGVQGLGAVIVLVTVLTGTVSAWTMLPALFLIACSMGLVFGPATSYALQDLRHVAGTALAVMGAVQFIGAGIVSPLVAIGGEHDPLPFALVVTGAVALAWLGWAVFSPRRTNPAHDAARTTEGGHHGTT
ncbi:multidrug effflux MFS transporter [Microbacterium fluvii]|uniref:Multidrug effflux MFS transporter n=1 Tax=Microbacterium fluvii TaxID=415215 RepID=A0ABW2HI90_9MICO|nr:multidrug effflux MFS transporter [Microbacterium fluvii]MCU4673201.1 multidrug effflux MFS transporter [Microbacterium fluvii]